MFGKPRRLQGSHDAPSKRRPVPPPPQLDCAVAAPLPFEITAGSPAGRRSRVYEHHPFTRGTVSEDCEREEAAARALILHDWRASLEGPGQQLIQAVEVEQRRGLLTFSRAVRSAAIQCELESRESTARSAMLQQFQLERELLSQSQLLVLEQQMRADVDRARGAWVQTLSMLLGASPSDAELFDAICAGTMSEHTAALIIAYHARQEAWRELAVSGADHTLWSMIMRNMDTQEAAREKRAREQQRLAAFLGRDTDALELTDSFLHRFFSQKRTPAAPFKVSQSIDRSVNAVTPRFERKVALRERQKRAVRLRELTHRHRQLGEHIAQTSRPHTVPGLAPRPPPRPATATSRCESPRCQTPVDLDSFFMPSVPPHARNGWRPDNNNNNSVAPRRPQSAQGSSFGCAPPSTASSLSHTPPPSTGRHTERPYFTTHFRDLGHAEACAAPREVRREVRPAPLFQRLHRTSQSPIRLPQSAAEDAARPVPAPAVLEEAAAPFFLLPMAFLDFVLNREQPTSGAASAARGSGAPAPPIDHTRSIIAEFVRWKRSKEARRGLAPVNVCLDDPFSLFAPFFEALCIWRASLLLSRDVREWLQPAAETIATADEAVRRDLCRGFDWVTRL